MSVLLEGSGRTRLRLPHTISIPVRGPLSILVRGPVTLLLSIPLRRCLACSCIVGCVQWDEISKWFLVSTWRVMTRVPCHTIMHAPKPPACRALHCTAQHRAPRHSGLQVALIFYAVEQRLISPSSAHCSHMQHKAVVVISACTYASGMALKRDSRQFGKHPIQSPHRQWAGTEVDFAPC